MDFVVYQAGFGRIEINIRDYGVIQSEVNFRIRDLHLCSRGTITEVWPQDLKAPESLPCPIPSSRASFESSIYWPEPVHNVVLNHLGKLRISCACSSLT